MDTIKKIFQRMIAEPVELVLMVLWFIFGTINFIGRKPTMFLGENQDGNPWWYRVGGALQLLNGGTYLLRFAAPEKRELSVKLSAIALSVLTAFTAAALYLNRRAEE